VNFFLLRVVVYAITSTTAFHRRVPISCRVCAQRAQRRITPVRQDDVADVGGQNQTRLLAEIRYGGSNVICDCVSDEHADAFDLAPSVLTHCQHLI